VSRRESLTSNSVRSLRGCACLTRAAAKGMSARDFTPIWGVLSSWPRGHIIAILTRWRRHMDEKIRKKNLTLLMNTAS
jgi:hypothetical protein